ncbi:MAG: YraN family protein [Propionibacteriales bacterium]|nr:YraN family protein [Propionibacteriales bacterium]
MLVVEVEPLTSTHAQRKALGDFGERLACRHLVESGLTVLDRNWRCAAGEIDIVASDGDVVVVCEVKTRSSARFGTPLEAITTAKANRLHRLGRLWLRDHDVRWSRLRVDVVSVVRHRRGPTELDHIVGVV